MDGYGARRDRYEYTPESEEEESDILRGSPSYDDLRGLASHVEGCRDAEYHPEFEGYRYDEELEDYVPSGDEGSYDEDEEIPGFQSSVNSLSYEGSHGRGAYDDYDVKLDLIKARYDEGRALRARAYSANKAMRVALSEREEVRRLGDISKADLLLKDANSYEPIRNRLHLQTFPKPFDYHNLTFPYDTIDLHELRVKETKSKNLPFIEKSKRQQLPKLRIIKGDGSRLKPATKELLMEQNLRFNINSSNAGVWVVYLT